MGPGGNADIICSAMSLPITFGILYSTQARQLQCFRWTGGKGWSCYNISCYERCVSGRNRSNNQFSWTRRLGWLTKDRISSGETVYLVRTTACLYSIYCDSPLVMIWVVWQQRSSGNKCNFASGHAFCVGGKTKKILDYLVKSRSVMFLTNLHDTRNQSRTIFAPTIM